MPRALKAPTWGGVAPCREGAAPPTGPARRARPLGPPQIPAAHLRARLAGRALRRPLQPAQSQPLGGRPAVATRGARVGHARRRRSRASSAPPGCARRPRAGCRPAALQRPVGGEAAAWGKGPRASAGPGALGPPVPLQSKASGARPRGAGRQHWPLEGSRTPLAPVLTSGESP